MGTRGPSPAATWDDIVGGAGIPPTPEPDPVVLDRLRREVGATARDVAFTAAVHDAVMAETDPDLPGRLESIRKRARSEQERIDPVAMLPAPTTSRRAGGPAIGALFLVGLATVVLAGWWEASGWFALAGGAAVAVSLVLMVVSTRRMTRAAVAATSQDEAGLRTDSEVEALFALVPADRVARARALNLALLREGYESGRVREAVARTAVMLAVARWTPSSAP